VAAAYEGDTEMYTFKRKLVSFTIAALLMLGSLVACGDTTGTGTDGTGTGGADSGAVTTPEPGVDGGTTEGTTP
jgi:hypothetical protein